MGYIGKVFKSGNSAAVRLPKSFGLTPGMTISLEQNGKKVTIAPTEDPAEIRRELQAAFDAISAIWDRHGGPPDTPMQREPDIFPDRPGLY